MTRDLGYKNRRFDGLDLAKEQSAFSFWGLPVVKQSPRCGSDSDIATFAPLLYLDPNAVDQFVGAHSVECPFSVEGELRAFTLHRRDWNEEAAFTPPLG